MEEKNTNEDLISSIFIEATCSRGPDVRSLALNLKITYLQALWSLLAPLLCSHDINHWNEEGAWTLWDLRLWAPFTHCAHFISMTLDGR